MLVGALAGYAAVAHGVVDGGRLVEWDADVARWVAREMPSWAEWAARPFTWLGGFVGMTIVVALAAAALIRRLETGLAVLLIVVAVGAQLLVTVSKQGYGRARPDVGSAIDLPTSFAFPSGHATVGIAVCGLLGLLAARASRTRLHAGAAVGAGIALGALIGASRVVLGVHYVSDVLAGICLGLAWLSVCLLVYGAAASARPATARHA